MKSNRFTSLTWAVPLIICLLLVSLSASAFAAGSPYIRESRIGPGFTLNGIAVTSAKSSAAGCTAGSGSYFAGETSPTKYGNWSLTMPSDAGGYYNVWATWASNAYTTAPYLPPIWTVTHAGATPITATISQATGGNAWNLIASDVQLNAGGTYTVQLNTQVSTVANKRTYFDAVKWEWVRTNAPSALTATIPGPGPDFGTKITLNWTAPTPAPASYNIQRKDGASGTWSEITSSGLQTTTTYVDTTGVCNIDYYFQVAAVDAAGIVSGWSNEAHSTKCLTAAPPGKATGPSPSNTLTVVHTDLLASGNENTPLAVPGSLSWTADPAATSQDVYFGTNSASLTFIGNQTATSYAPGALLANTNYYWRINEKNLSGTTTGDLWTFKTGVSLTVKPIRNATRGTITFPVDMAWNTVLWYEAGTSLDGFAVAESSPYEWIGWSLNADGTLPFSTSRELSPYVVPSTSSNLYAVFKGAYNSLTVAADPVAGGTVSASNKTWPSAALTQFESGDVAHIIATPAAGYKFAGWKSDKAGTFTNRFAATTDYAMTTENTAITAYFAKAYGKTPASAVRSIVANDLAGTNNWSYTSTVNIGSYTYDSSINPPGQHPENNKEYARVLAQFSNTIPAMSLRAGLGKLEATHATVSSLSSSYNTAVSAYPATASWDQGAAGTAANWLNRTAAAPWTTPGGDMDTANELGTAQTFVGIPNAPGDLHTWDLTSTTADYRALLANGIEFQANPEGPLTTDPVGNMNRLAYRKGFGYGVVGGAAAPLLGFFYNPPTGAGSGVLKDWAYLGFYPLADATADPHLNRITVDEVAGTYNGVPVDVTTLAPKVGASLGTYTWALGSSSTDLIDLLGASFYNNAAKTNGVTYLATYINNPGSSKTYYIGLGADDYSKTWLDTSVRASKSVAEGVGLDQAFQGPFTLLTGWHRLLVKVENGIGAHGAYVRLANADRTALTGIGTLTFATTDTAAPTNPTATVAGTTDNPTFTLVGATDNISGVRGFKVYFGANPAGVPSTFQTAWTYAPGVLTPGTYYLRVVTVDYALNESAVATVSTFVASVSSVASYGLSNKAVLASVVGASAATKKFTVWGKVTVINADSFNVDDGSGAPVKVLKTAHGFTSADYVSATGTLNVSGSPAILTAQVVKKQN